MKKVLFVTASPESISCFLLSFIDELSQRYEVHVASNISRDKKIRGLNEQVIVHAIDIAREPSLFKDIGAIYQLCKLCKKHNFDFVHSVTPKAGLIGQIASFLLGVPHRLHTFTGQVWCTRKGLSRFFLKRLDKLIAKLASHILIDSPSQRQFLLDENVVSTNKSQVLCDGSISGIDIKRFQYSSEKRAQLRLAHGFTNDDFIFLFVGRLKKEKGIIELLEAFSQIDDSKAKLVIIGSDEEGLLPLVEQQNAVHYLGFKTNVDEYYSMTDILCLPSHREGFGNVVIEAAATSVPTIASDIYGLSDAVVDNETGILHQVQNADELKQAMEKLLTTPDLLATFKQQAYQRAIEVFPQQRLTQALAQFYLEIEQYNQEIEQYTHRKTI